MTIAWRPLMLWALDAHQVEVAYRPVGLSAG